MSVTSFTLRVSGVAALSDNTERTFLALHDPFGDPNILISVDGNEAFRANYPSKKSEVEALAIFNGTTFPAGAIVPSADPADSGLVVTSLSMVVTGRVTLANNTQKDFSYEVRDDGNVYNHVQFEDEGNVAWRDIAALVQDTAATTKAIIDDLFTQLYSTDADPIGITLTT